MIFVKADDLKYGMRLAKPIYNKSGVLLYERNTKLTIQGIESVKNFGLLGLYILEPAEPVPPMSDEDLDFERFQTMAVFSIRQDLDTIIEGGVPENLQKLAKAICFNYGNLDHKINFTQNIRSLEDYIYKHVINVAILTALMANQLRIKGNEAEDIVMAALLHDIGKILLPEKIRTKFDNYDNQDLSIVKKFQVDGLAMIEQEADIPRNVKRLLTQLVKIEYDQGNEPVGKLLIGAKIIRVANKYDVLTAMKLNAEVTSEVFAIKTILESKMLYDPSVIEALTSSINILSVGVCVELTNGAKGLVIQGNDKNILKPMILTFEKNVIYDIYTPSVYRKIQIKDVMKTMDNRIIVDEERLNEYLNKSL